MFETIYNYMMNVFFNTEGMTLTVETTNFIQMIGVISSIAISLGIFIISVKIIKFIFFKILGGLNS